MGDPNLRRAERRLDDWLRQVDMPVHGMDGPAMVPVGMALRGRELYRGVRHALSGPSLASAAVILRSLVDLAILTRWLEIDAETHVECWFAEDDRQSMDGIDRIIELNKRRERTLADPYSPEERTELRAGFVEFRQAARDAGIRLQGSALLPGVKQMADTIEEAWEIYNIAFRVLSPWVHAGGRSFAQDRLEQRADGQHLVSGFPFSKEAVRALAVVTMLFLLASISRQLGLGWEAECDQRRIELARWGPGTPSVQYPA